MWLIFVWVFEIKYETFSYNYGIETLHWITILVRLCWHVAFCNVLSYQDRPPFILYSVRPVAIFSILFSQVLTRRICWTIKSFYRWSFPLFSWPLCVIWGWYCKEKFSQDLIVNSPLWLVHISFLISFESLVLDQDNNFFLISLSILITCWPDNVRIL